jgi:hypothetical protein
VSATLGYKDDDLTTFRRTTGATDLSVIASLTKYLKEQGLWNSVRFFPFKSTQNYSSGTTIKGLGGWTANDISLVGGPVIGATGTTFDATDDRGTWNGTGIETLSELYVFDRQKPTNASLADTNRFGVLFFGSIGGTPKFWLDHGTTSLFSGETTAQGVTNGVTGNRNGTDDITWAAGGDTQIVSRYAQTGSGMWKSKTAALMDKNAPTPGTIPDLRPSTAGWSTDSILRINSVYDGSAHSGLISTTRISLLFCKTALTQSQRETITDYLDQF